MEMTGIKHSCRDGDTRSGDPSGTAVQEILSPGRQVLQINSKLLAFLIQMTPLKAQCLRGLRDMSIILFEFSQYGIPFESQHSLRQRPRYFWVAVFFTRFLGRMNRRQCQVDILGIHFSVRKQQ